MDSFSFITVPMRTTLIINTVYIYYYYDSNRKLFAFFPSIFVFYSR